MVLMDIQMPEMDGIEATAKILAYFKNQNKKPPIILAVTANVIGDTRDKCIKAGMLGFIPKPVSPQKLEESLSKWLSDYIA